MVKVNHQMSSRGVGPHAMPIEEETACYAADPWVYGGEIEKTVEKGLGGGGRLNVQVFMLDIKIPLVKLNT